MIDFQNKKVFKLSKGKDKNIPKEIFDLLLQRVGLVITLLWRFRCFGLKKILPATFQGLTGSKKEYTSLPVFKNTIFII